jgi:hypothetical protein
MILTRKTKYTEIIVSVTLNTYKTQPTFLLLPSQKNAVHTHETPSEAYQGFSDIKINKVK